MLLTILNFCLISEEVADWSSHWGCFLCCLCYDNNVDTTERSFIVGMKCDINMLMMCVSHLTTMVSNFYSISLYSDHIIFDKIFSLNSIWYFVTYNEQAKVIKTKSMKYIPFWFFLTNFLNGLYWTTYALLHPFDVYVLVIYLIYIFLYIVVQLDERFILNSTHVN